MTLAIIGGTGVEHWPDARLLRTVGSATSFGLPSAPLQQVALGAHEVWFLSRHGVGHDIAPHRINYRANIRALADAGVDEVLALNAVGIVDDAVPLGGVALPDQLIDYTSGRESSFFDGVSAPLQHIDFTEPYCGALRAELAAAAGACGWPALADGIYGATQGPRLETTAEVARLARDGVRYIGMTGAPEACLAREAGLSYACVALIVNAAAGRGTDIHADLGRYVECARTAAVELVRSFLNRRENSAVKD